MLKKFLGALLLAGCALLLGATVFREQVASAAEKFMPVLVTNDAANPVPVREQGTITATLSGSGNTVTAGDRTELLLQHTFTPGDDETIDVARYKKIRISIGGVLCTINDNIRVFNVQGAKSYPLDTLRGDDWCGGPRTNFVYSTPGRNLTIRFDSSVSDPSHTVDLVVFGRSN